MNCVIPGPNLKILGKAIHSLAKIGDEVYLEANEDNLSLRTVNISTTVFGFIKFLAPFFTHYKINDTDTQVPNDEKGISCKMPMKAILGVFRNPTQMEKQVEVCKIEINNNPTKITFKFRYKHDISKTHHIWLLDGDESLQLASLNDTNLNKLSASSSLYSQALANFQISDGEVSVDVTPQKIIFRNYTEGEVLRTYSVRSQLSLNPSEFSVYKIYNSTTITFSLRAFRAAINFAETFNLAITMSFQKSGKPLEITISNNVTFEANFILATMSTEDDTQSSISTITIESIQKRQSVKNKGKINNTQIENKRLAYYFNSSEEPVKDTNSIPEDVLNVSSSPDTLRSKKLEFHFQRCYEQTLDGFPFSDEEIYAENSDPECESLFR